MKILQYNIQSLKKTGNKELLELFLVRNNIDIAVLIDNSLMNYNFAFKNRPDGFGGVGIYIYKSIRFSIVNFETSNDTLIIATLNLRRNFNIICKYSPPNMPDEDFRTEMRKIFGLASSFDDLTLICGDFNAKSPSWSRSTPNCKSVVDEYNCFCLNNGNSTFIAPNGQSSALDLTFI